MAIVSVTSEVAVMNAVGNSLRTAYPGRRQFNIKSIIWSYTGGVAPVTLILEDDAGSQILEIQRTDAQDSATFEFPDRFFDDLEIDTIDAGTLYIYLR